MSDPITDPDGERLSAWLTGDLDDAEAAVLERRLRDEPALGERLDRMASLLVALRGLDEVEVPADVSQRLRQRLAREQDAGAQGAKAVETLSSARAARRRRSSRTPWPVIAAAAAAVVAIVAIVPVLGQGLGGQDSVAEYALEGEADGGAGQAEEQAGTTFERSAAVPDAAARPERPVITEGEPLALGQEDTATSTPDEDSDDPVTLEAGEDPLWARFAGLPEVTGLLGVPVEEAAPFAEAFAADVRAAPPFVSGAEPGDCLDVLTDGASIAVPVRVEAVTVDGAPALAYVLVTASAGSTSLDRAELWLVSPLDCTTREYRAL